MRNTVPKFLHFIISNQTNGNKIFEILKCKNFYISILAERSISIRHENLNLGDRNLLGKAFLQNNDSSPTFL